MEPVLLIVRENHKGLAVYAGRDIKKGERVCEFRGPIITGDECDPNNDYYLQIDDNLYMGASGEYDDLINHSCNPNGGLVCEGGRIFFMALRDIPAGEELTFDYSTSMDEDNWEMECHCGEIECRGTVRDFKYLPEEVRERYLSLGVVLPFIARKAAARCYS